jgi:ribose-phosphate pyrophosphokinase
MARNTACFRPTLISGDANPALAAKIAKELKVTLEPVEAGTFADGETRVHIAADVRDATVVIIQPTSPPVNNHLMTLALLADAARAAGAARVIGVLPYFGYSRQEQRSRPGEARSAQVVARFLGAVQIDHLVSLDLHAPALESALPMPAILLRPDSLFLPIIREWDLGNLTIVAPDAGGMKRAQRFASQLNAELAVIAKARQRPDVGSPLNVLGIVRDRDCVIVDDMASTGRTLVGAANALRNVGARTIHAVFTHAIMANGALERLSTAPLDKLVTSDSVPLTLQTRLKVISTAALLAAAIREIVGDDR